jgi:hypothetical protein
MVGEAARYSPAPVGPSQLRQTEPVFDRLLVDGAGNLWVQRGELHEGQGSRFDVIAAGGRFPGEVRSPVALAWIAPAEVRAME